MWDPSVFGGPVLKEGGWRARAAAGGRPGSPLTVVNVLTKGKGGLKCVFPSLEHFGGGDPYPGVAQQCLVVVAVVPTG